MSTFYFLLNHINGPKFHLNSVFENQFVHNMKIRAWFVVTVLFATYSPLFIIIALLLDRQVRF